MDFANPPPDFSSDFSVMDFAVAPPDFSSDFGGPKGTEMGAPQLCVAAQCDSYQDPQTMAKYTVCDTSNNMVRISGLTAGASYHVDEICACFEKKNVTNIYDESQICNGGGCIMPKPPTMVQAFCVDDGFGQVCTAVKFLDFVCQ
jgi:hypothetical protein